MLDLLIGFLIMLMYAQEPIFPANKPPYVGMGQFKVLEKVEPSREKDTELSSRGVLRTLTMEITAYSEHYESCGKRPSDSAYGITASGERVRKGIVAADTRIVPMHSLVLIEGLGVFEVKDTGGDIKGNRLDLYMPSHQEALKWGRQKRKVQILRIGSG